MELLAKISSRFGAQWLAYERFVARAQQREQSIPWRRRRNVFQVLSGIGWIGWAAIPWMTLGNAGLFAWLLWTWALIISQLFLNRAIDSGTRMRGEDPKAAPRGHYLKAAPLNALGMLVCLAVLAVRIGVMI